MQLRATVEAAEAQSAEDIVLWDRKIEDAKLEYAKVRALALFFPIKVFFAADSPKHRTSSASG